MAAVAAKVEVGGTKVQEAEVTAVAVEVASVKVAASMEVMAMVAVWQAWSMVVIAVA